MQAQRFSQKLQLSGLELSTKVTITVKMTKIRYPRPERPFTCSELVTPPRRYPLPLPLRYRTTPKYGTLHGAGLARMMSSQDIIFAPGDGLVPGMEAEIAVAWPFLLDGSIHLQLVLEATITSSEQGLTEARILAYDFRTRRVNRSGAENWSASRRLRLAPDSGIVGLPLPKADPWTAETRASRRISRLTAEDGRPPTDAI